VKRVSGRHAEGWQPRSSSQWEMGFPEKVQTNLLPSAWGAQKTIPRAVQGAGAPGRAAMDFLQWSI